MFAEERPHLKPLPLEGFRFFRQEVRTVDDSGLVQVQGAYYAALPAAPHTQVTVRLYAREIEILDEQGRCCAVTPRPSARARSCCTRRTGCSTPRARPRGCCARVDRIGPASARLAGEIFARLGRPGQRAIYGLAQLPRHHTREEIESACTTVLQFAAPSYQAIKRVLERRAAAAPAVTAPTLAQAGEAIRHIDEYHAFWEHHAQGANPGPSTPHHRDGEITR